MACQAEGNSDFDGVGGSDVESVDSGDECTLPDVSLLTFEAPDGGAFNTVSIHPTGQSTIGAAGEDDTCCFFKVEEITETDLSRRAAAESSLQRFLDGDISREDCAHEFVPSRTVPSCGSSEPHADSVSACSWSHDGRLFATAGYDEKLRIFRCGSDGIPVAGATPSVVDEGSQFEWLTWHPKGHAVLAGGCGMSWLLDGKTGRVVSTLAGLHSGEVSCGKFCAPDLKYAATASIDGSMGIWEAPTGQLLASFRSGIDKAFHKGGVLCMDALEGSPLIATGSEDFTCKLESATTCKVLASFSDPRGAGDAVIHAIAEGHCVTRLKWHPVDPSLLVSAAVDGSLRVWDIRTSKAARVLTGHRGSVFDLAVVGGSAGCRMVSASEDGTCKLWAV
eukprot:Polyplicarium_translucidae@DN2873_c0_g1_i1.p1